MYEYYSIFINKYLLKLLLDIGLWNDELKNHIIVAKGSIQNIKKIPDSIKKEIVDPYISIKNSEARISLRIKDSLDNLRRNDLLIKINSDLENKLDLKKDEFKLGGVLILFNNLLQSLFKSQILTLGFVMFGIFVMFIISKSFF